MKFKVEANSIQAAADVQKFFTTALAVKRPNSSPVPGSLVAKLKAILGRMFMALEREKRRSTNDY